MSLLMNCKLGAIFCLSFRKQRRLNFDIIQEAVLFARLCGRIKPDRDANIQKKKIRVFPMAIVQILYTAIFMHRWRIYRYLAMAFLYLKSSAFSFKKNYYGKNNVVNAQIKYAPHGKLRF